jgi:hypothetical protein
MFLNPVRRRGGLIARLIYFQRSQNLTDRDDRPYRLGDMRQAACRFGLEREGDFLRFEFH